MNWEGYEVSGQMSIFDCYTQDMLFGKTSSVHCQATTEKTFVAYWNNLQVSENQTLQYLNLRKNGGGSGLIEGDDWSIAWRVVDSRFWGNAEHPTPQRRRRIALVSDFGGTSAGRILFECESLPRYLDESNQAKQETTNGTCERTSRSDCEGYRKVRHAQNVNDFETWERTDSVGTLNVHDNTDIHATTIIVQNKEAQ